MDDVSVTHVSGTTVSTVPKADAKSRGHSTLYWTVAGGMLLVGVLATVMSLVLPATYELLAARILSTSIGVALTALSSAVVAYVLTWSVSVADVEAQHTNVLDRIARSLAHVHTNLQWATAQRRTGAFEHEETYQELVLSSANSLLKEFDGITRLSGSISGAFQDSKRDLDEVRRVFDADPAVAQTVTAARYASTSISTEMVTLPCPVCSSRVSGELAMRAGWTANVRCSHCKTGFNIHRRGDLTVYASPPRQPTTARQGPEVEWPKVEVASRNLEPHHEPERSTPAHLDGTELVAASVEQSATDEIAELNFVCPSCSASFVMRVRSSRIGPDRIVKRRCTACGCTYRVHIDTGVVEGWTPGAIEVGVVVARRASYAMLACPVDGMPLQASFAQADGDWRAYCQVHDRLLTVTRAQIREWMEEHDPAFLAARLVHENEGGARVISEAHSG